MDKKSNIEVGGFEFKWNPDAGQLLFDGQDSIIFWISSAMKSFFDTIEEI